MKKRNTAKPSRRELFYRIEELEAKNEDLQSRLDEISGIANAGNDKKDADRRPRKRR